MPSITPNERLIGRLALPLAWFALVAGQFHAMARHQTADGRSDLDSSLVSAWSDPARDVFRPLLDWADPDIVYVTWGKIWLPVFIGLTLCAFAVHRHRHPVGFEKIAWRVTLTGYVLACVSVAAEYWTSWTSYHSGIVDGVFPFTIVAMLTTVIGSTMLGISLLRRGFRPRTPAILLAAMIPGLVVISSVTSMGSVILPASFAFGILGRRLAAGASVDQRAAEVVR
jgi:hypothetical protein